MTRPTDIIAYGYATALSETLNAAKAAGVRPDQPLVEECARLGVVQRPVICRYCGGTFGALDVNIVAARGGAAAACKICGSLDLAARQVP